MTITDYTLFIEADARSHTTVFRWKPKIGRHFQVRVCQLGTMEEQRKSFSKQLYDHALRLAEHEFDDGAAPNQVAQRADEIMVELAEMINKPKI